MLAVCAQASWKVRKFQNESTKNVQVKPLLVFVFLALELQRTLGRKYNKITKHIRVRSSLGIAFFVHTMGANWKYCTLFENSPCTVFEKTCVNKKATFVCLLFISNTFCKATISRKTANLGLLQFRLRGWK